MFCYLVLALEKLKSFGSYASGSINTDFILLWFEGVYTVFMNFTDMVDEHRAQGLGIKLAVKGFCSMYNFSTLSLGLSVSFPLFILSQEFL